MIVFFYKKGFYMSTLIRLKRRKKSENEGVTLHAGEPYYNMADKALYVAKSKGKNRFEFFSE